MCNEKLADIIKNGGIAIIPTDTVYGIVCDALNEEAVKKVYDIKKRDYNKPMIVLVSDLQMLDKYVTCTNSLEKNIMNKFWPGPLTIILEKNNMIPDIVTANKNEIGVRIPDDLKLRDLIRKVGTPIIATSANKSSKETITSIDLLEEDILNSVDYVENCGYIKRDASTIIKAIKSNIKIIREGILSNDIIDFINNKR